MTDPTYGSDSDFLNDDFLGVDPHETHRTVVGPDTGPIPEIRDRSSTDDDFDFEGQDLDSLTVERKGIIDIGDDRFEVSDPENDEEIAALLLPVMSQPIDSATLFERALLVLVSKPDLDTETIRSFTPSARAFLAMAALDWFDIEAAIDEIDDLGRMRVEAHEAFSRE